MLRLGKMEPPSFPALERSQSTDVCVVGAGIAGLSVAYQLIRRGLKVIVLEKRDVGGGETGLSSGHLSDALDDGFQNLARWHRQQGLKQAILSHRWAIDEIERIQQFENISCDFARLDGFLVRGEASPPESLKQELQALHEAGITEPRWLETGAPFDFGEAIHFPRQAQFNPLAYVYGLAKAIKDLGGEIHTHTPVIRIEEGPPTLVHTDKHFILADQVVLATNVPFNNRIRVHTKLKPTRTYLIALKVPQNSLPPLLLWDTADPYHYLRIIHKDHHDLLLVGGGDHKTGQNHHPDQQFKKLREWVEKNLKMTPPLAAQWSGQIIEPADGLAYIGRNPGSEENIFIVTGDSGHGLTHGTIAGKLIADLITLNKSPWQALYDPARASWRAENRIIENNLNTAAQYLDWVTPGEVNSEDEIAIGQGAILRMGAHKLAIYRESEEVVHRLSAVCPHMNCVVQWNQVERTWDCPCHGSRFDRTGAVLNGPAQNDLNPTIKPMISKEALWPSNASP